MQPLRGHKQPNRQPSTGNTRQIARLPGKSSGLLKGNRDKINSLIDEYNAKSDLNKKLKILLKIRSLYDPWITKIKNKLSKKEEDPHLTAKLKELKKFGLIIEEEAHSLNSQTISNSGNSIPLLNSNFDEFEEKIVLAEYPAQNHFGGHFDFSGMNWDEDLPVSSEQLLVRELLNKAGLAGANKINDQALSRENAIAFVRFFEANPKLLTIIKEISLENNKGQGGGLHKNGSIYINPGEGIKDSFMGILVHEMGHASLQRLLKITDHQQIDTEDGKKLAEAWSILCQDEQNFFGLDLGTYDKVEFSEKYAQKKPRPRDPQARQKYQKDTFIEFVAESFMHMALVPELLKAHVNNIRNNPEISWEAKQAWETAIEILERNGNKLLGL
ncbi:hypothetical protein [Spirosoma radiotolerans]|uniref:Uncharacterized protein n=1 Tax=Spirosoma radiotolerans TaxID=1379870 RepID=A0A0E3ZZL9_9BACT|nr:hypothetical protein [Spirosoma radiotolerans]AKD57440.1 hypothetical protein SD10_23675 [Spirosoma radiotolerans]